MNALVRVARATGLQRVPGIRNTWRRARKLSDALSYAILERVARSGLASSLYYGLFSRSFRREHQAVLAGRVRYHREETSDASSVYLLRRNIHRLEKGLIMRPRRSVFATDYVKPTVDSYCQICETVPEEEAGGELVWAGDVLETYFAVAGGDPVIEEARARYRSAVADGSAPVRVPYERDLSGDPPVALDDLLKLAVRRRSVRWFQQKPVPRELIDRALEVAVQAPSACNRQPYHFRIFDTPERVREIASIPMGTRGFSDNFPAVAVVVGEQRAYFDERDRHVIYIDASLASMGFILALESLGLASCCINWPDMEPQESRMKAALGLGPDERVIMLIALGYPDPQGKVPYSQKRSIEAVRTYE